jgi:hypothetical protein
MSNYTNFQIVKKLQFYVKYIKEVEKGIIRHGISVVITIVKWIVYRTGTCLALCLTAVGPFGQTPL